MATQQRAGFDTIVRLVGGIEGVSQVRLEDDGNVSFSYLGEDRRHFIFMLGRDEESLILGTSFAMPDDHLYATMCACALWRHAWTNACFTEVDGQDSVALVSALVDELWCDVDRIPDWVEAIASQAGPFLEHYNRVLKEIGSDPKGGDSANIAVAFAQGVLKGLSG